MFLECHQICFFVTLYFNFSIVDGKREDGSSLSPTEIESYKKEREELIKKTAERHIPSRYTKNKHTNWFFRLAGLRHISNWRIWGKSRGFGIKNKAEILFGLNLEGKPAGKWNKKCKLTRTLIKQTALTDKNMVYNKKTGGVDTEDIAQDRTVKVPNGLQVNVDDAMKHATGFGSDFHDLRLFKKKNAGNYMFRQSTKNHYKRKAEMMKQTERLAEIEKTIVLPWQLKQTERMQQEQQMQALMAAQQQSQEAQKQPPQAEPKRMDQQSKVATLQEQKSHAKQQDARQQQ
ncbi:MAG: hypothetical protein Ta2D_11540 [Rickettsiales bacterium]|nr:MAG: hypothetical protein Ta2D_11540 [Rickettsiales bacterium]